MVSIYQSLYDLINTYVYGGAVVAGSHMDLICVLLSTMGVVFLVALPFLIVWRFICLISGS